MAAALSANSEGPKPVFDTAPQALLERFRVKSELQSSTVDIVAADADVPAAGARDADLVGITGCFCAVAETGTLMMCSSPDTPAAVSLLPETHVAVVQASRIVAYMEDAWNLARKELGTLPRAVNFISGPSRTGDIEQTIVLGAHGPYRVHLVIVEG